MLKRHVLAIEGTSIWQNQKSQRTKKISKYHPSNTQSLDLVVRRQTKRGVGGT